MDLATAVKNLEAANAALAAAAAAVDVAKSDVLRAVQARGLNTRYVLTVGDAAWYLDPGDGPGEWTVKRGDPPVSEIVDPK